MLELPQRQAFRIQNLMIAKAITMIHAQFSVHVGVQMNIA